LTRVFLWDANLFPFFYFFFLKKLVLGDRTDHDDNRRSGPPWPVVEPAPSPVRPVREDSSKLEFLWNDLIGQEMDVVRPVESRSREELFNFFRVPFELEKVT
jgi:hypothetical protein